ncbi:uncharacterized protein LOC144116259 [Amblyomma americanum]
MGKVKLKRVKGSRDGARPADHAKFADARCSAASQALSSGANAEELVHRLGLTEPPGCSGAAPKTKKDKRKMRHEAFIKKLEAGKVVKSRRKCCKKKAPMSKSLDMKHLFDALPAVTDRTTLKSGRPKGKSRASKSFQANKKLLLKDMKHLEQVVKHPHFQANPMEAVLNHLRHAYGS